MDYPRSGIVTMGAWLMASNGKHYMYFFSSSWEILTDKEFPVEGFRSTEHWHLLASVGGEITAIIPGYNVRGLIVCDSCPDSEPYVNDGTEYLIYDLDNNREGNRTMPQSPPPGPEVIVCKDYPKEVSHADT